MKQIYKQRVRRVREVMRARAALGVLLPDPLSIRAVTGHVSEADQVLITQRRVVWFTDARGQRRHDADLSIQPFSAYRKALRSVRGPLLVDAAMLTVAQLQRLRRLVRGSSVRVKPVEGLLDSIRVRKSTEDIRLHARAASIADEALAMVRSSVAYGVTEWELAQQIERSLLDLGAERPAFETIVAFSENAAVPHHRPSRERRLRRSDVVLIDMGAVVEGRHSDMTRTYLPTRATREQRRAWEAVVEAQRAGVLAVRAGVSAVEVDEACRAVLREQQLESLFIHATGHGVGLEIHEAPVIAPRSEAMLEKHMLVTVEPGVYMSNTFGVRIEDTCVVTNSGARVLTNTPIVAEPFVRG